MAPLATNIAPRPAVRQAEATMHFYERRTGRLTDPFGHDWEISRHVTPREHVRGPHTPR
jgi:uncharacterized glyoxalase superfamily protein PhnB